MKKILTILVLLVAFATTGIFAQEMCYFSDNITVTTGTTDRGTSYVSFKNSGTTPQTVKYKVIFEDGSTFGPTTIYVPAKSRETWWSPKKKEIMSVEQCW